MNYTDKVKRRLLISYLKSKTDECDWHAVSDAANDLRVLEERMRKYEKKKGTANEKY